MFCYVLCYVMLLFMYGLFLKQFLPVLGRPKTMDFKKEYWLSSSAMRGSVSASSLDTTNEAVSSMKAMLPFIKRFPSECIEELPLFGGWYADLLYGAYLNPANSGRFSS